MERQFLAVVNHNGSCGQYHYQMGKQIILPESVIYALGKNVTVLQDVTPQPIEKEPMKDEGKPELEPEKKEIKFPIKDKMIKKPGKSK